MTRIDFYILPEGGSDPVVTAARLCDKAVSAGHSLYVTTPDAARMDALDDLRSPADGRERAEPADGSISPYSDWVRRPTQCVLDAHRSIAIATAPTRL